MDECFPKDCHFGRCCLALTWHLWQGRVWGACCCMQCCLFVSSRTGFHGHSIPGHLWRRVTAGSHGARDAIRQDAWEPLRSDTRMWRKCPKCPSPVAARSGFRLPQDLQGSIIWWLPGAQFMLYMRENYASRIYDSRELDQRFFLTPLQFDTKSIYYLWPNCKGQLRNLL